MKKLLVASTIILLGISSLTYAAVITGKKPAVSFPTSSTPYNTNFYVGVGGGLGITNWKNVDGAPTTDNPNVKVSVRKDQGFVGRLFFGYDITRYFAIEFGYSYFFNKQVTSIPTDGYWVSAKETQDLDFMGKFKAPVIKNVDLYLKVGGNYLMTRFDYNSYVNTFNFACGAGVDYFITPNIIANIEWLRFGGNEQKKEADIYLDSTKQNSNYQPHTDAFLIGLRYKFGE